MVKDLEEWLDREYAEVAANDLLVHLLATAHQIGYANGRASVTRRASLITIVAVIVACIALVAALK